MTNEARNEALLKLRPLIRLRVLRFSRRAASLGLDVEDLESAAYLAVISAMPRYRSELGPIEAFASRVAFNTCCHLVRGSQKHYRRRDAEAGEFLSASVPAMCERLTDAERDAILAAADLAGAKLVACPPRLGSRRQLAGPQAEAVVNAFRATGSIRGASRATGLNREAVQRICQTRPATPRMKWAMDAATRRRLAISLSNYGPEFHAGSSGQCPRTLARELIARAVLQMAFGGVDSNSIAWRLGLHRKAVVRILARSATHPAACCE